MFAIATGILTLVSAIGWFWCLGSLAASHITPLRGWRYAWLSAGLSFVLSAVILALASPQTPLTFNITSLLGWGWFLLYWAIRPPLPQLHFPSLSRRNTIFLFLTIFFLILYAAVFVFIPLRSFDALSYHIPFAEEFSSTGQVGYPSTTQNWVDHIHYTYPRAIDLVFGLVLQFHPFFYGVLHFWILLLSVGGIIFLSIRLSSREPFLGSALILSLAPFLIFMKMFPVELGLFTSYLLLLALLSLQPLNPARMNVLILVAVGAFFGLSKFNSFALVLAACAGGFFLLSIPLRRAALPLLGFSAGAGWFVFLSFFHGKNFWHELAIVQATTSLDVVSLFERVTRSTESFFHYLPFVFLLGIIASILLHHERSFRPWVGIFLATTIAFILSFVASPLNYLTYSSVGMYAFSFTGLSILFLSEILSRLGSSVHALARNAGVVVVAAIILSGSIFTLQAVSLHFSGYTFDSASSYPKILNSIPHDSNTVIFFMNTINPLTHGLEKTRILDHTTFPTLDGSPCDFWKRNGITHVIYWSPTLEPRQLDKGNPTFYDAAREELRSSTCTRLLIPHENPSEPLVGEVIYAAGE